MIGFLKNIYKKLNANAVNNAESERMPYREQLAFLDTLPDPKDDYERSFLKYLCFSRYCYYQRSFQIFIYNIGAMLILPFLHLKYRMAWRKRPKTAEPADAVIENVPRLPCEDVIPDDILKNFSRIKEVHEINYLSAWISDSAEDIVRELRKRYFFHFYFRVIVMVKLALFSQLLDQHHPKAIAFYSCEREFSAPLQTMLCENNGCQYISYMHGDYISTLCFAYQKFSKFYIWDESYRDMFELLKWSAPMEVYTPVKLKGIADPIPAEKCRYFATYYFSDESREEILTLYDVFSRFEAFGLRTKVRPHPRFSDVQTIREVFKNIEIEDLQSWSLSRSVYESAYVVGLNTTVLSQAFFSGKQVVIDDVSNPGKYNELDERGYIMMRREHSLLSQLVKDSASFNDRNCAFSKQNEA